MDSLLDHFDFFAKLGSMSLKRKTISFASLACTYMVLTSGCTHYPPTVELPAVDSSRAASFAMEQYDANDDGALVAAEMASCPPLVTAMARYDADGNGSLSAEEIEARLTQIYGTGAALTNVDCTVLLNGRAIDGALVKFRPVEMLKSSVKAAEAVTDPSGRARLALRDDDLPQDLKDNALMYPGLYHVEITHPKVNLPARYNDATELGFEVDPSLRGGTSAQFNLRLK
jgi:hypothetical protein